MADTSPDEPPKIDSPEQPVQRQPIQLSLNTNRAGPLKVLGAIVALFAAYGLGKMQERRDSQHARATFEIVRKSVSDQVLEKIKEVSERQASPQETIAQKRFIGELVICSLRNDKRAQELAP
ncbi:hypothetical protein HY213_03980 [Candidatus Peregrinibacteria bacterium]|nr:hypothetical protein [Candidatus Peregrinibacteria bacterium]